MSKENDRTGAAPRLDIATLRAIPAGIWAVGFVSLLMDMSSEMIHALLPVYLVTALGASALTVGVIEGIAEATAAIVKVFSGALSDWFGKRKLLAVFGYGLAAITKPVFPLAASIGWIAAARFVDRIGKGIRGAPRDALLADITPKRLIGASYGLRQSLDTVGAVLGPLVAMAFLGFTGGTMIAVFWIAVAPAFLAACWMAFAVREPKRPVGLRKVRFPLSRGELGRLPASYWWGVTVATAFMLARFSEAFLILRAQSIGLSIAFVPVVLVVMSVAFALAAYPAGVLSDIDGRRGGGRMRLLVVGLVLLIASDIALALAPNLAWVLLGVALWGLHMGFSQGLLSAFVADTAPAELRGTAFGAFNMVTGLALLAASIIAGALWDWAGPQATFGVGAVFAAMALVGLRVIANRFAPDAAEKRSRGHRRTGN